MTIQFIIQKQMRKKKNNSEFDIKPFVIWIPRVLMSVFVALLGLFSFSGSLEWTVMLIQFIPALVVLVTLILAWEKPFIGGLLFLFWGLAFTIFFGTYQNFAAFMAISIPLFSGGGLFIMQKYID